MVCLTPSENSEDGEKKERIGSGGDGGLKDLRGKLGP